MAISGAFAGLAGALDMLGYLYHFGDVRHPGQLRRLPRHRCCPARPQHGGRRRHRRPPLRRAPLRDDARALVERDRSVARRKPHLHDPGPRRPLRRRRRPDPLRLGCTASACARRRPRRRLEHPHDADGNCLAQSGQHVLRNPAATGYAGMAFGVFAAFLGIPPFAARTVTWALVAGIVAVLLGIATVSRGRQRLGFGAIAAGVIGVVLGLPRHALRASATSTSSSTRH